MGKVENTLDLRRLWRAMKKLRWIYLASVAGFLCLAGMYWYVALPLYTTTGMMLVEDSEAGGSGMAAAGGMGQMMKTFSIGGFGGAAVDNEIEIAKSHDVMMRVIRNLQLNRSYTSRFDGDKCVLWNNSPIKVEAPAEFFDTISAALKVRVNLLDNGKADIKVTKGFLRTNIGEAKNVTLPATVDTEYGKLQILKTANYGISPYTDIKVSLTNNEVVANGMKEQIMVDVATKLSDIIMIEYPSPNRQMGMDVVNAIMTEYNIKRLDRSHRQAAESVEYYDGRIAELMAQLSEAEKKVVDYQSTTGMYGEGQMASMLLGSAFENRMAAIQARNTISYYERVLATLRSDLNNDVLVPSMEGQSDANVSEYNNLILKKKEIEQSAKPNNPGLKSIDSQLEMIRPLVIENAEKIIGKAKNDLTALEKVESTASSKLTSFPEQSMTFANLLRDREIKNSTYAFLLQSREEAVLKLYSTTTPGFVFEEAYSSIKPDNMKKILVVVICLFLGIFFPSMLAVWMMIRHKNISDPIDLTKLGLEQECVVYDGSKEQINRLRGLIIQKPELKTVYASAIKCDGKDIIAQLAESLLATGAKVAIIPPVASNDIILSEQWKQDIDAAMIEADYVIATVPEPTRTYEIATLIDNSNSQLLAILDSNKTRIALFKQALAGIAIDKLSVCLKK